MKVNITAHPTHDGWYYLDYRPNGSKGKREREPVEGYEAACARRDDIEASCVRTSPIVVHPAIKDVYKEYLAWVERTQAPATYKNKVYAFEGRIIPHFGAYRVRELTMRVYDEFQKKHKEHRRGVGLNQDYLGALIKWMVKRKMAEPLTFIPEKPAYHSPIKQVPHPADVDRVIAAVGDEGKRMLLTLMLYSGLRYGEASVLQWQDVDMQSESVRVRESQQEAEILVPIPAPMVQWFKDNRKLGGWIFPNRLTGKPYGSLKNSIKAACKKVGVSLTPHTLRRCAGTYTYEATGDIYAVKNLLNHKDIKTSIIYTRYSTAKKKKDTAAMIVHMDKLRGKVNAEDKGGKRRSSN